MLYQQVTLSGDAEWPKVADAVIEAFIATLAEQVGSCLEKMMVFCDSALLWWLHS